MLLISQHGLNVNGRQNRRLLLLTTVYLLRKQYSRISHAENSEQVKIYENQILMIKFTQCTCTVQSQVASKGQGCQLPEAILGPHTPYQPSLKHYSKKHQQYACKQLKGPTLLTRKTRKYTHWKVETYKN